LDAALPADSALPADASTTPDGATALDAAILPDAGRPDATPFLIDAAVAMDATSPDAALVADASMPMADTRQAACAAPPPRGSFFSGDSMFTQTWDGADYAPATVDAVHSESDTAARCEFHCNAEFAWNGMECLPLSNVVRMQPNGTITYQTDSNGNRVPDFSIAGYMNSSVPIPNAPVMRTVYPVAGDDQPTIQAAIDEVSMLSPDVQGIRGAVLLGPGTFELMSNGLSISSSGVVLRGSGAHKSGTIVVDMRTPSGATQIQSSANEVSSITINSGSSAPANPQTTIVQTYVPTGTNQVHVNSTNGFSVGDRVMVVAVSSMDWLNAINMGTQWGSGFPNNTTMRWERTVRAVDSATKTITLDGTTSSILNKQPGTLYQSASLYHLSDTRTAHNGVEDLILVSTYNRNERDSNSDLVDEDHAFNAIKFTNARDGWVRRVMGFFYVKSLVAMDNIFSGNFTVQDCAMLDGVSNDTPRVHAGGRKYYFSANANQILVQRNYARGARHAFIANGARNTIVFLDNASEQGHLAAEPHQVWTQAVLFDNVYSDTGFKLNQAFSAGHGQRAVSSVLWNVLSESTRNFEPEIWLDAPLNGLGQNYAVGVRAVGPAAPGQVKVETPSRESCIGSYEPPPNQAGTCQSGTTYNALPAQLESVGTHVMPRSLFMAQLRSRVGDTALNAVTTPLQRSDVAMATADVLRARFDGIPAFQDPAPGAVQSWLPDGLQLEP